MRHHYSKDLKALKHNENRVWSLDPATTDFVSIQRLHPLKCASSIFLVCLDGRCLQRSPALGVLPGRVTEILLTSTQYRLATSISSSSLSFNSSLYNTALKPLLMYLVCCFFLSLIVQCLINHGVSVAL